MREIMEVEVVQDIQNAEQESHATHLSEHSYSKVSSLETCGNKYTGTTIDDHEM